MIGEQQYVVINFRKFVFVVYLFIKGAIRVYFICKLFSISTAYAYYI